MDRLHPQIGELVGDVVIGAADLARLVGTDQPRVGARQVKLLVDDRLARAGQHGEAREGHFGVPARIAPHHAALAPGIAGDDRQCRRKVDRGEGIADSRVEAAEVVLVPQGQVDEAGVDVAVAEQQRGAVRAVRLADPGEQFAHRHQLFLDAEAAMRAQPRQVVEARGDGGDAGVDEGVGLFAAVGPREHAGVARVHRAAYRLHRLAPAAGIVVGDEAAIDAGRAAFLVLEQQVGHPAIGRHDEDAVIKVGAGAAGDQHIVEQGRGRGHRGAADLLDAMVPGHAATAPASGPRATASGSGSPRWARNHGRGFSTPNGFWRPLLTAL